MIRKYFAVATLLLAAACSKTPEDVSARYSIANGQGTITVKAAGNGDTRLEAGPQTFIRHDGTDYFVLTEGNDRFAATIPDFVAAMGELIREGRKAPPPQPKEPEFEVVKGGEETIAGLKGTVWKVQTKPSMPGAPTVEVVVTDDPAFANISKAMVTQAHFASAGMEQLAGHVPNLEKKLGEVLEKGMVLRFGDGLKLEGIEKAPIAKTEFTLPKVLDKAALKTRLDDMRKRSIAEQAAMAEALRKRAEEAPAPGASPSPAAKAPAK